MRDLRTLEELADLVGRRPELYVRWSGGPEADASGTSVDHLTGTTLPGLSVHPLRVPSWWPLPSRIWVARRLHDYISLAGSDVRPWILEGREVARGPDDEPLVRDVRPVAALDERVLAEVRTLIEELKGDDA